MLQIPSTVIKRLLPYYRTLCTTKETSKEPSTITPADFESENLPPPWENPWIYALGKPPPPPQYTDVVESKEEFKWVHRLKPLPFVPEVPHHDSFPTPSGWRPPKSIYNLLTCECFRCKFFV